MQEKKILLYEAFKKNLKPDKKGKGYICPICSSGTGKNGTGITENPKNPFHYTCWKGCFKNADAFDIIALEYGLPVKSKQAINKAYSLYKAYIPLQGLYKPQESVLKGRGSKHMAEGVRTQYRPYKGLIDKIAKYADAFENSPAQEYLFKRGISDTIAKRFSIGYSREEYFPDKKTHEAIILPVSNKFYIARNIKTGERYSNSKGSNVEIFNISTVLEGRPVFITEGIFDALSIIEVGANAIALNGVSNINKFLEFIEKKENLPVFILALDADDAGIKATERLTQNITFLDGSNILLDNKDVNQALLYDREEFANRVLELEKQALNIMNLEKENYINLNTANFLNSFLEGLKENSNNAVSTGFDDLDKALDGGLYSGLYFLGAISSLGKTTFALQLADNIALSDQDVLFFSLEMARNELISKSISRLTFFNCDNVRYAKTTRNLNDYEENNIVKNSIEQYKQIASKIWIFEGIGNLGVNDIKESIQKHIHYTGNKPVVFIDYVQILSPYDVRATDKQNTDKAVLELKRLSRDFDIPIFCISSLNRESYSEAISMKAFKESGAIEYGSDVLLGLQYKGIEYKSGETDKNRQSRMRELIKENEIKASQAKSIDIELKVLKNRNGKKGLTIPMIYYPMFNVFLENDIQYDTDIILL